MYTVIIPTMWRAREISLALPLLDISPTVGEILIINNDRHRTPMWFTSVKWNKVRTYSPPSNIFVNPAFNLGVSQSHFDKIVLLQDDVVFDPTILTLLHDHIVPDRGPIGCDIKNIILGELIPIPPTDVRVEPCPLPLVPGWAVMMAFHKSNFVPIDESLKIHLGEDWIVYTHIKKNLPPLILKNFFLTTSRPMQTSGLPEFKEHLDKEGKAHQFIRDKLDLLIP